MFFFFLSFFLWMSDKILFFFPFSFIIHMCIQGLVHFSPLPPPLPYHPLYVFLIWLNSVSFFINCYCLLVYLMTLPSSDSAISPMSHRMAVCIGVVQNRCLLRKLLLAASHACFPNWLWQCQLPSLMAFLPPLPVQMDTWCSVSLRHETTSSRKKCLLPNLWKVLCATGWRCCSHLAWLDRETNMLRTAERMIEKNLGVWSSYPTPCHPACMK
jgi:hypothetical protein